MRSKQNFINCVLEGVYQDLPALRASPPNPLSNFAASPLRGEGEKPCFSGSPSPRNEVELERGRGVRREKGFDAW
jgi:hypothetical protein